MRDHPVIKFTLLFIVGIISAKIIFINIYILLSLLLLSVLLFILVKRIKENKVFFQLVTFILAVFIFSIGNHYSHLNQRTISPQIKDIDKVKDVTVTGIIDKIDLIRKNELILYLSSDSIYTEKFFIVDEIPILCKIQLDSNSLYSLYAKLEPGNRVRLKGFYYKGRERRNPALTITAGKSAMEIAESVTDITQIKQALLKYCL